MWYRGGEWDLRVEGGRSQSQGWHTDQGPCKGGRQHILIQIIQIITIIQIQIKDPAKEITHILLHPNHPSHRPHPSSHSQPHVSSPQSLVLVLEERDAEELVLVLTGYFTLATESDLSVTHVKSTSDEQCEYLLRNFYHWLATIFLTHAKKTWNTMYIKCTIFVLSHDLVPNLM